MATNQLIDNQLKTITIKQINNCNERSLGMLTGKKYCITDLEYIVENSCVSLCALLKSQHLTSDFCVKYMLVNHKYCIKEMDKHITYRDVLYYQPHLNESDLDEIFLDYLEQN